MNIENYREENNKLIRSYLSSEEKAYFLKNILNSNFDFVTFIIKTYFPEYINDTSIYGVGIQGLIKGINNYQMDKISSFESFILVYIKNEIENFINENTKKTKGK